ncbi:MAG TPA: Hsp20/alpha crystallin family protein, partial [Candidatus Poseidoniales archaeon]|nr:Hsp20/alpha crystallin family protein [Candidatus Poseidoniales archaeon]
IGEMNPEGPQVVGEQIQMTVRKGLVLKDGADGSTKVRMYLPGARKEEIGLKGRDNHLLVSVNGHEAAIDIRRDFDITGLKATFKDSILSLTLPPSPAGTLSSEEE